MYQFRTENSWRISSHSIYKDENVNRSETMGKYGREKNKEDNVTEEDVSVSKNKEDKESGEFSFISYLS